MVGDKPKVWITGAAGLIGSNLVKMAPTLALEYQAVPLTRRDLDLTEFSALEKAFNRDRPSAIVHCAAMSRSPECQATPKLAWQINTETTAKLAELASGIPFFFFSTDLVFDGKKGNYVESDATNPLSIYAETKVAAEQAVLRNPKHTVIRTSLNAGKTESGNRTFNEEMCNAWRQGKTLNLFKDEYRSPIGAEVTARAVWELLKGKRTGIFHVAGSERLSRFQIGEALAARFPDLNPKFLGGSLKDYQGAPRSPDTSLDCSKAQAVLGFQLPGFRQWLQEGGVLA